MMAFRNAFWLEGVLNLLCSGTFPIKKHYHTYKGRELLTDMKLKVKVL